jgi:hypothetical protein
MSNMWRWADAGRPQTFAPVPWALDLKMEDFPYPKNGKAEWFWEGGFFRHPINDLEYIRDWNFRANYGAFSAMKNGSESFKHVNAKIEWMAYIGGSRESRLLRGDIVLTREAVIANADYADGCVPSTWSIDLHVPQEKFAGKFPEDPFISKALFDHRVDKGGYPVPYRCFYSRNIPNLFMAGRHISVDHGALGTVRVMRTCGMEGEVVGRAASICVKENCTPRDVYLKHLDELKKLMGLPGRARRATVNEAIDENAPLPEISQHPAVSRSPGTRPTTRASVIDIKSLPGILVDDAQATFTGTWVESSATPGYVDKGYHHDNNKNKGECSARYEFKVPAAGRYEVRLSYRGGASRATNIPVAITSAEGEKTIELDEQKAPALEGGFASLGTYRFDSTGAVLITNKGTKGHVVLDAVQLLPVK